MANLNADYLNEFVTSTELRRRWEVSDRTLANLEKSGDLKAYKLLGKSNEKRYRATDIAAIEAVANPPKPGATALRRKAVAAIVEKITRDDGNQDHFDQLSAALLAHIDVNPGIAAEDVERFVTEQRRLIAAEATARPANVVKSPTLDTRPATVNSVAQPEPIAESRRRRLAFEAFDALVDRDDRVRSLLEKTFTDKLDDPTFTDADVEPLVAKERAGYAKVLSMLTEKRHRESMASMFPSKSERDARIPKVERAKLPRSSVGMTADDNANAAYEVGQVDVVGDIEPYVGPLFGENK